MAMKERYNRNITPSYEYQPLYTGSAAVQPAYPGREQEEPRRVRRTRQRPQQETQVQNPSSQGMSVRELRQLIAMAIFVGVLLIGMLIINAYAASIQCSINDLKKANMELEDEIDALNMKIYTGTSIEQIESYAMGELNMRYPTSSQCIYIEEDDVPVENFASVIRQKVYE